MAGAGAGAGTGTGTAPWALQVERFAEARAPELQSLFAAIKVTAPSGKSCGNVSSSPSDEDQEKSGVASFVEIPGHLRRRTRSHNRRKYLFWTRKKSQKRAPVKKKQLSGKASIDGEEGEANETRKRELKVASLSRRVRRRIEFQELTKGNVGCSRDGTQRLVTHVWHTKRFYMAKMWGYWLPKGLSGRGRGAKAVLRWCRNGTVVHDASYYSPIQLEGLQDDLSIVLSVVLEPLPGKAKDDFQFMGACYSNVMIHRCGKVPFSPIAPAMVIFGSERASSPSEENAQQKLWVWVHAAAFDEAFNSLQAACDGSENGGVRCRSRKGELARLEVLGMKSSQVLEKILKPRAAEDSAASLLQRSLTQADVVPARVIVSLEVHDPRDIPTMKKSLQLHSAADTLSMDISKDDRHEDGDATMNVENSNNYDENSVSYWRSIMRQSSSCQLIGSSVLWESPLNVEPPLSDKSMNRKQHKYRLSHYHLGAQQNDHHSDWKTCPIMLLKHDNKSYFGWSIILPVKWVHAFWMTLVLAGARVVGQSERRWLMTDAGLPSFPYDFPDCQAYENYISRELQEQFQIDSRRPPGKRLARSLPSPPWMSIPELIGGQQSACQQRTWKCTESPSKGSSIDHEPAETEQQDILMNDAIEQGQADLPMDAKDKGGLAFPGFVARSWAVLSRYMRVCSLSGVLVFPEAFEAGKPVDIKTKADAEVQTPKEWAPCFLRILVRAARKGVVEEGSVLYAPKMEDFDTWLCRSQSWQGVEVPVTKDSRDDTPKAGSIRDAMGFVTSAAPWQSNDAAIAFGGTSELAKLRVWQLADGRWDIRKAKVFVLFHNPRSTKLRPALASIVLETGFVDDTM